FFFQAEDGIRDRTVTGVQTCALPICRVSIGFAVTVLQCRCPLCCRRFVIRIRCSFTCPVLGRPSNCSNLSVVFWFAVSCSLGSRSEERRVGKECRFG